MSEMAVMDVCPGGSFIPSKGTEEYRQQFIRNQSCRIENNINELKQKLESPDKNPQEVREETEKLRDQIQSLRMFADPQSEEAYVSELKLAEESTRDYLNQLEPATSQANKDRVKGPLSAAQKTQAGQLQVANAQEAPLAQAA